MLRHLAVLIRESACRLGPLETARCAGSACRPYSVTAGDVADEPTSSGSGRPPLSKFAHTELAWHYSQIPIIYASDRNDTGLPSGTWASRKLRQRGFVTGQLDSLPLHQPDLPLIYPNNEINTFFRRLGSRFSNQICHLHIIPLDELQLLLQPDAERKVLFDGGWEPSCLAAYQVLPRRIQMNEVRRELLNVTMMHCPDDRIVHCRVPVVPINEDEAAYIKRGGWTLVTTQFVTIRCAATNIPLGLEVDCSKLESGAKFRVRDLELAQGQHVVGLPGDVALLSVQGGRAPTVL